MCWGELGRISEVSFNSTATNSGMSSSAIAGIIEVKRRSTTTVRSIDGIALDFAATCSAGGTGSASVTRNILTLGRTNPIAKPGRNQNASPFHASTLQIGVVAVSGKVKTYYNAANGSKNSVSPVFAY